mmetsp:Transcript_12264/g.29926  ORF Transcript_12264/g.29926 Transcript_12264/m.29926 type:complete len:238 (-) Transcript_12264:247-960(-)
MSSVVMVAWRLRLYASVSLPSISPALLVEFSMALMRDACSEQLFSSMALNRVEASWNSARSRSVSLRSADASISYASSLLPLGSLACCSMKSGSSTVATVGLNEMADRNLLYTMRMTSGLFLSSSSAINDAWANVTRTLYVSATLRAYSWESVRSSCERPLSPMETTVCSFTAPSAPVSFMRNRALVYLEMLEFRPPHRPRSEVIATVTDLGAEIAGWSPNRRTKGSTMPREVSTAF